MSSNIRINKVCQYCGGGFEARKTTSKTCSDDCAKRLYKLRKKTEKMEELKQKTHSQKIKPFLDMQGKEFLTVREVAKLLNCSRQTVYSIINNGTLKAVNLSIKKTIVRRQDIDKLFS